MDSESYVVTVFLLVFEKMRHVALKTSVKSGTYCQYFAIALEYLLRCLAVMWSRLFKLNEPIDAPYVKLKGDRQRWWL
jgi:hypothetical protein